MRSSDLPAAASRILLLALLVTMSGCVSAKMYRPDSVEEQEDYTLTFIEFDDHGEPWAPAQLERTIQVIDQAHIEGKRSVVLLFVHGWCCDRSHWRYQLDVFAADHRVVALDLPGHGDSGARSDRYSSVFPRGHL